MFFEHPLVAMLLEQIEDFFAARGVIMLTGDGIGPEFRKIERFENVQFAALSFNRKVIDRRGRAMGRQQIHQ